MLRSSILVAMTLAIASSPAAAQSASSTQARNPLLVLVADGKDRHVRVNNLGDKPIHYLYASPTSSTTWEEDLLGDGTIAVGASRNANIDNGTTECNYDLKVVKSDGAEVIRRNVNVCAVQEWVIGASGDSIK